MLQKVVGALQMRSWLASASSLEFQDGIAGLLKDFVRSAVGFSDHNRPLMGPSMYIA